MKKQDNHRANERGSAVMIVFILIALFAALTAMMVRGSRVGETTVGTEQNDLAAAEIIDYLTKVRNAYKMLLINGCTPETIDFTNSIYLTNDGDPLETAPASTSADCKFYSAEGGGIKPQTFDSFVAYKNVGSGASSLTGHFAMRMIVVDGAGTAAKDPAYYTSGFKLSVCLAVLNSIAGSKKYTTVPTELYNSSGSDPLIRPENNAVFAVKLVASNDYCNIGIVLAEY